MKKQRFYESPTFRRILYWVVMASFIISFVYVIARVIFDSYFREHSEYKIMIFQTCLGMLVINFPTILTKKFNWHIPTVFYIFFMVFLFGSIVLGEIGLFYYKFTIWDDFLHLSSSMMLAMLGFSLVDILNHDKKRGLVSLSPAFVSIFSATFAVFIGVIWEIFEFMFDAIIGMNMQKYAVEAENGKDVLSDLVGRAALMDTMTDLIIDFTGAIVIAVVGYISLKLNNGWMKAFKVEIRSNTEERIADAPVTLEEAESASAAEAANDNKTVEAMEAGEKTEVKEEVTVS